MKYWRIICFLLIICALHLLAARSSVNKVESSLALTVVQKFVPQAASLTSSGSQSVWEIRDSSDQAIALACLTSPQADMIVGYAGPNNILLIMDTQGRVTETHWLNWLDTQDHVEKVQLDDNFWNQFHGRQLGDNRADEVDGVSGATLTSLAIAEAIELRLSGTRPSLRFPQSITLEEVQSLYPTAARMADDPSQPGLVHAIDAQENMVGSMLRTGPLVDNQIGYQGPSELLVAFDQERDQDLRITKVKLRSSFDNEPYVRYTRMEASFWAKFAGRTLAEISQMDLAAEGIEGVSGATMTSMAAADTLRTSAQRHLAELERSRLASNGVRRWNWSIGEIMTAITAMLLVPWSVSRLRGRRSWRVAWQSLVFLVVVGVSGNLISMALLAGWARSWPPITLAPGLTLMVAVSLIMPAFFGRNVYCDHVCPHGMLQQWLAGWQRFRRPPVEPLVQLQLHPSEPVRPERSKPKNRLRIFTQRALHGSSIVVLLLSISWIVWTVPNQLTFFEPFDVYAWRIGWSVSLAVWVASLLLAAKEPMGYCRFACPTGKLLEGIRKKRTGQRWQTGDMLLVALTVIVWLLWSVKHFGLGEIT